MFTLLLTFVVIALWIANSRLKRRVETLEERVSESLLVPPLVVGREPDPPPIVAPPPPAAPRPPASTPPAAVPPPIVTEPVVVTASQAEPSEGWEVVVGTSWLNKLGVLVFVIGLALLVGYSVTQLGPAGRVAIGFSISVTMLVAGVVLEHRATYRNYAYGLIAGGWAGAYFTAYAMHALPAARIVDSPLIATSCLAAIAAGIVVHSLRYRSQTVTALAYVVAYATLALTPLSGFSLVASVPLTISLLVVSQRLGWSEISILGLISTYGIFVLRSQLLVPGGLESAGTLPYAVLGAYWLTFEAADVIALRARKSSHLTSLFPLNAVAFIGSALMELPANAPAVLSLFLASTACAYLASAIVRWALLGDGADDSSVAGSRRFTTAHAAVAVSAALVVWSIELRFNGPSLTMALLLETELLVMAGFVLGDQFLRRMGAVVAILVTSHALSLGWNDRQPVLSWFFGMSSATPVLALTAAAWYANREWIRALALPADFLERHYARAATVLVAVILGVEMAPARLGLAGFVLAAVLLEAGFRRATDYRYQAYVIGIVATWITAGLYLLPSQTSARDVWIVLPGAIGISVWAAIRLARKAPDDPARNELRLAAGVAGSIGAGFLALFQWRVFPVDIVQAVWASTALILIGVGISQRIALCRWHGYLLAIFAAQSAVNGLDRDWSGVWWPTAVVVTALYAASAAGRAAQRVDADVRSAIDRYAHVILAFAGTWVLATLEWRAAARVDIGGLWAMTGWLLVVAGITSRLVDLRWQGYAMLLAGSLDSLRLVMAPGPAPAAAIVWMTADILALYTASLLSRGVIRTTPNTEIEAGYRVALSLGATLFLTLLILAEVTRTMITLSWGLAGLSLLVVGFPVRERVLRLSGMALLFLCLIKLFFNDLGRLDAWPRIISFVVLGLVLLAVSWLYTRLRGQARRFL